MSGDQTIRDADGNYVSGSLDSVKEQGEVMTPPHIVDAMLAQIPDEVWSDPTYVFLEPSCGTGNFLVAVIRERLSHGIEIEVAFNTLVGMDCNCLTLHVARGRLMDIAHEKIPHEEEKLKRIGAIIWNNVFHTKDSIKCIQGSGLGRTKSLYLRYKKFVYDDPTWSKKKRTDKRDVLPRCDHNALERTAIGEYEAYVEYVKKETH